MKRFVFFFMIIGMLVTVNGQIQAQQQVSQQPTTPQIQALNNQQLTELLLKAARQFNETSKAVKEMPDLMDKKIRQGTVELNGKAHKELQAADAENAKAIKGLTRIVEALRAENTTLRNEVAAAKNEMKAGMEKATATSTAAVTEAKDAVTVARSAVEVAKRADGSAKEAVGYAKSAQDQSADALNIAGSAEGVSKQAMTEVEEARALAAEAKEQATSALGTADSAKTSVKEVDEKLSDRIGELERAMLALSRDKEQYYAELYSRFNGDKALLRALGLSEKEIEKGKKEANKE